MQICKCADASGQAERMVQKQAEQLFEVGNKPQRGYTCINATNFYNPKNYNP